jgi:hypothetical protein
VGRCPDAAGTGLHSKRNFNCVGRDLRAGYFRRLTRAGLTLQELRFVALQADGFSLARLRESYIMAGQLAADSHSPVIMAQLGNGIDAVRRQITE